MSDQQMFGFRGEEKGQGIPRVMNDWLPIRIEARIQDCRPTGQLMKSPDQLVVESV